MSTAILSRIPLWPLILLSLAMIGLDFQRPAVMQQAQLRFNETLKPFDSVASFPWKKAHFYWIDARSFLVLRAENQKLTADNQAMMQWQARAQTLAAENALLKAQLHFVDAPVAPFIAAQVVADMSGVYNRSVLVPDPAQPAFLKPGDMMFDGAGLAGRVTQIAHQMATVMLLTDGTSRVPVLLGDARIKAILVGDNDALPLLRYWPDGTPPHEGDAVVTSAEGGAFPAGLAIGAVHWVGGQPKVALIADLKHLNIVRVLHNGADTP